MEPELISIVLDTKLAELFLFQDLGRVVVAEQTTLFHVGQQLQFCTKGHGDLIYALGTAFVSNVSLFQLSSSFVSIGGLVLTDQQIQVVCNDLGRTDLDALLKDWNVLSSDVFLGTYLELEYLPTESYSSNNNGKLLRGTETNAISAYGHSS